MAIARDFTELEVYRVAFRAAMTIFSLSATFPKEERYALTDQVRRSSRAVGSILGEAWAKRRYKAHFIAKITDAIGEANETRSWLLFAEECGYLNHEACLVEYDKWQHIGAMLASMINKVDMFCHD